MPQAARSETRSDGRCMPAARRVAAVVVVCLMTAAVVGGAVAAREPPGSASDAASAARLTAHAGRERAGTGPVPVRADHLTLRIDRDRTFTLPIRASHVALHWAGQPHATIEVAFSRDGRRFGAPVPVGLDEVDGHSEHAGHERLEGHPDHPDHADRDVGAHPERTYSSVLVARGARALRVTTDRPLGEVSVVVMDSRVGPGRAGRPAVAPSSTTASTDHPPVISRADWGADEALRYDGFGEVIKPLEFHPVQKLIVHHTAGSNGDPDPPATVRAIYYFHAIVRAWGDIGYNFLIDEAGNVYEGRYSRPYGPDETPTGENRNGKSVQGAHAADHNGGSIGIALLGTLTKVDATPAARATLERLLVAKAHRHGVDPEGAATYVSPATGVESAFPNIAGHRDVNATSCPGGVFYATLPDLRQRVSALIGPTFWQSAGPRQLDVPTTGGTATFSVALRRAGGFPDPVDLEVSGLPTDWTVGIDPDPVAGHAATLTIAVPEGAPDGTYRPVVTGTAGSVVRSSRLVIVKGRRPDTVPPTLTAPRASVQLGSKLSGDEASVLVRWSGADDQGPIMDYALQRSSDGGPWEAVQLASRVSRFNVRPLLRGHTYHYRVRATDAAGNRSRWATGPPITVRRLQETARAVAYSKGWTRTPDPSASAGYLVTADSRGSTATLSFTARGVGLVLPKDAMHGRARILIDGSRVSTIDLATGPTGPRRVAFIRSWKSLGAHTLTIRVLEGPVDIDAFVLLK